MSVSEENALIEGRPSPWGWLGVVVVAGIGGLGFWLVLQTRETEPSDRLVRGAALVMFAALPVLSAAAWGLWLARARIIADEWGLRWRHFGGWRSAAWEAVSDYYEEQLPDKNLWRSVVETAVGKVMLTSLLTQREELRAAVAARAVHARAQAWEQWGLRETEAWPLVFRYDTAENRSRPWVLGVNVALLLAICVGMMAFRIPGLAADLGWPMALAAALLMVVTILGAPAALIAAVGPALMETRRRWTHCVIVDPDGIRYRTPESEVAARWSEVTAYHFGPASGPVKLSGPAVVVTRGGTFEFVHSLHEARILRAIIQKYAVSATTRCWRDQEEERLGDPASCWTSGCRGVGQRVFHYRTRTNRAMLLLAGAHCLIGAVRPILGAVDPSSSSQPEAAMVAGGLTLGLLWLIWRYQTAAILLDDRGLTQRAWNGTRTLAWSEVEELSISGDQSCRFGNVKGRGGRLRFWLGIADVEELLETIAARAPHAQQVRWRSGEHP